MWGHVASTLRSLYGTEVSSGDFAVAMLADLSRCLSRCPSVCPLLSPKVVESVHACVSECGEQLFEVSEVNEVSEVKSCMD